MQDFQKVLEKLSKGHLVIFLKEDGKQQVFKVINGMLNELKDKEWKERIYLPRWGDLQKGKWIF